GGEAAAVAENGGGRATGGRGGARLQQSVDGDHRVQPDPGGGRTGAQPVEGCDHANPVGGGSGGGDHAAAAGLQPEVDPVAAGDRFERCDDEHRHHAAAADRGGYRDTDGAGAGSGDGESGSGASGAGDHEPGGECAGRDAERGQADAGNGKRGIGRGVRARSRAGAAGTLRDAGGERHGNRDDGGHAGAYLRTLFHDQGSGQGDGSGTVDGVRNCETEWRGRVGVQRAESGGDVQGIFSADRSAGGRGRSGEEAGGSAAGNGDDSAGGRRRTAAAIGRVGVGRERLQSIGGGGHGGRSGAVPEQSQ